MTGEEVKYDQRFNIVRKRVHSSTSVEYSVSFDDAACSFFSNISKLSCVFSSMLTSIVSFLL